MQRSVHCPKCSQALRVEVAADGTCVLPRRPGKRDCPAGEQVYKYVDHGTPAQQRTAAIKQQEAKLQEWLEQFKVEKCDSPAIDLESRAMDAAFARD